MSDRASNPDDRSPVPGAAAAARESRVPRLISRLYRGADASTRAGMLAALIRPLGPLGLAAVASGAFAGLLLRRRGVGLDVAADEAGRYTAEQVFELARFVEQVDAEAFRLVAGLALDNAAGLTTFGVAVALLLLRRHQRPWR